MHRPCIDAVFRSVLALIVLLASLPSHAQFRPFVSIDPSSSSVDPGGQIVVDLGYGRSLSVPPPTIMQLTGSVTWDASSLTLISAVPQGNADYKDCVISAGRLDFDFAESSCQTGVPFPSGPLCRLTFVAASTQATRNPLPLTVNLSSCNDAERGVICKRGVPQPAPAAERTCDTINGSITVHQAQYASTPAPDTTIDVSAPLGGTASTNLSVRNDGTFPTTLDFNGQSGPISLIPDAFALAPAQVQAVQVSCSPTALTTAQQLVGSAVSNDPDRNSVSYTISCSATLTPERDVTDLTIVGNNDSVTPVYDASGRFVVFQSDASNLTGFGQGPFDDGNGASDIFRLDTESGQVVRISVDDAEAEMSGASIEPSLTADGMQVAFVAPEAAAKTLWGESKSRRDARRKGSGYAVLLRNLVTGTTQQIGGGTLGGTDTRPYFAPGAGAIAYTATNVDPELGAVGQENVFVMPLVREANGMLLPREDKPICASCKARNAAGQIGGNANGVSGAPVLSADGRVVVFETRAKNLLSSSPSPCPGTVSEVVLFNLLSGAAQRMSPPSGISTGACGTFGSSKPSIDYSGGKIAFQSDQGLNPGHAAGTSNVYVLDRGAERFLRVSETDAGAPAGAASSQPVISGDGRSVAYVSAATNLDDDFVDSNGQLDVHARRLDLLRSRRLSLSVLGQQANAAMRRPALSYNGARLAFDSEAANLVLDDDNGASDVFRRPMPDNAHAVLYSGFE